MSVGEEEGEGGGVTFYYFLLICPTVVAACVNEMDLGGKKKWMQRKYETPELADREGSSNETRPIILPESAASCPTHLSVV